MQGRNANMGTQSSRSIDALRHAFGQADNNFFMLDENISHFILRGIVAAFGQSSHVRLEGLQGPGVNDEHHIWPYMVARRCKAILTADGDFKPISIRHRIRLIEKFGSVAASGVHTPVVVHVAKNISRLAVLDFVLRHESEIKTFVSENNCAYAEVNDKGLTRHEMDATLLDRNIRMLHPHSHSLPQPFLGPVP